MLLRARTVLPISAPPIEDGAVLVRGWRVEAVGRWSDLRRNYGRAVIDVGDAVLLPGLINTHCHLDYTDMAGKLSPAKKFSDWIKAIVALKAQWGYTEFASSWLKGANMLLRSGATTVVDIEAVPELLPEVHEATPLRVISCVELLSIRSGQNAAKLVHGAANAVQSLPNGSRGLSPHAPYTTSSSLLREAARVARADGWLLTTHVAESADEFEMFRRGSGAMFKWLQAQRDMSDCDGRSPVQHMARSKALGKNCLAIHVNYLAEDDASLLAESGTSVVHCPRSHAFFGHRAFPFAELSRAGVNICLGTDSLATVAKSRGEPLVLSMFSEMRALAKSMPALGPDQIIKLATVNGAKAIGREDELGIIKPGALADLIALPTDAGETDFYDAVLNHRGEVCASMIRGAWAIKPGS